MLTNQKGNLGIIISLVILVLIIICGIYYFNVSTKKAVPTPATKKEVSKIPIIGYYYDSTYPSNYYLISKDDSEVAIKKYDDVESPILGIRRTESVTLDNLAKWLPLISTTDIYKYGDISCKQNIEVLSDEMQKSTDAAQYGGPFENPYKDSTGRCWFYDIHDIKFGERSMEPYPHPMETATFTADDRGLNGSKTMHTLLLSGGNLFDFYIMSDSYYGFDDESMATYHELINDFKFSD